VVIRDMDGVIHDTDEVIHDTDGVIHDTDGVIHDTDGVIHDTDGVIRYGKYLLSDYLLIILTKKIKPPFRIEMKAFLLLTNLKII
jgi:hypothetical protein